MTLTRKNVSAEKKILDGHGDMSAYAPEFYQCPGPRSFSPGQIPRTQNHRGLGF